MDKEKLATLKSRLKKYGPYVAGAATSIAVIATTLHALSKQEPKEWLIALSPDEWKLLTSGDYVKVETDGGQLYITKEYHTET